MARGHDDKSRATTTSAFMSGCNEHEYAYVHLLLHFFFNDTATTEIYTLSLHDALPISWCEIRQAGESTYRSTLERPMTHRSEEHTSELQSHLNLVCRLLLEKKKKK